MLMVCVRQRFHFCGLIYSTAVVREGTNIRGYQCWDGQFGIIIMAMVFSLNTFDNNFPHKTKRREHVKIHLLP